MASLVPSSHKHRAPLHTIEALHATVFLTAAEDSSNCQLNTMYNHLGSNVVGDRVDEFGLQVCHGGGVVVIDLQAARSTELDSELYKNAEGKLGRSTHACMHCLLCS